MSFTAHFREKRGESSVRQILMGKEGLAGLVRSASHIQVISFHLLFG